MLGFNFEFARVSNLQFFLTMAVSICIIVVFSLYMLVYIGYFGKPMFKYLTARLNPGTGIIQEYIHENVKLKMASVKNGEFTDLERKGAVEVIRIPNKKVWKIFGSLLLSISAISAIFLILGMPGFDAIVLLAIAILTIIPGLYLLFWKKSFKTIYHAIKPIIAQSITTINGVQTLLIWNVTPPLPERYLRMLEILIESGFNSLEDIEQGLQIQEGQESPVITLETEILSGEDKITIKDFVILHTKIRDRNLIVVTPEDIMGFSGKYMDEHAKKSVIEKEVTIQQKRLSESKYQTYAFYIIAIMVIGGFILKAWQIHNGGK
ncbi:MAG: hypothetical protein C3F06_02440 [Candidatus Methanoperedenaceae archaeon]|nr:MAG: hypothetical protein C3F06_02440 [Candidatus Methanoperedenaceae archaeon]